VPLLEDEVPVLVDVPVCCVEAEGLGLVEPRLGEADGATKDDGEAPFAIRLPSSFRRATPRPQPTATTASKATVAARATLVLEVIVAPTRIRGPTSVAMGHKP